MYLLPTQEAFLRDISRDVNIYRPLVRGSDLPSISYGNTYAHDADFEQDDAALDSSVCRY